MFWAPALFAPVPFVPAPFAQAAGEQPAGATAVLEWVAEAPNGRVWHLFEVVSDVDGAGGWTASLQDEDGRELLGLEMLGRLGRASAIAVTTPDEGRVPLASGPLGEVGGGVPDLAGQPAVLAQLSPVWPPRLLLAAAADGSGRGLARHCETGSDGADTLRCWLNWTGLPEIDFEMVLIDAWVVHRTDD